MKRWVCVVIATAAISGCTERQALQSPPIGRPMALILDGAHNGDPDFFFLPPLVANPVNDPHFDAGQFDASLTPTVEVCQLAADPRAGPTSCAAPLFGPVNAPVDASNQQYQFNWDTKSPPLVDPSKFYRIRVRGAAGKSVLGSLDVDPVDQGMKNLRTGDVVQFQDGRTLPIKFRIEQGERCTFNDDCTTQLVNAGGATIISSEAGGGVSIPPGALDAGEEIAVTIAKVVQAPGQPCLAQLDVPQFEGCFSFIANPPLSSRTNNPGRFNIDVDAAICVEVPMTLSDAQKRLLQLHAFDEERGLRALANASAGFLPCEATRFAARTGSAWRSAFNRLAALVTPRPAFAAMVHLGVGGRTCCFSDVTWGLPSKMAPVEGTENQTGTANQPVETPPAVLVTDGSNNAVAGATIHFRITSGGGSVTPATVVTGANGIAQVNSWVIGPGTNTLEAFATGIGPAPDFPVAPVEATDVPVPEGVVTFTATGTSTISGYEVVTSSNFPLAAAGGFIRATAECPTGKVVLGGGALVVGEGAGDFNTRLQESGPGTVGGGATSAWLVSMKNEDVNNPHSIGIFAVCANPLAGYEVVASSTVPLGASGGFTRQTAQCPAGKLVLGGGALVVGENTADFNTRLQESGPSTTGGGVTSLWLVSMKNTDAGPHTIQIFAVCANPPTGYEVVVSSSFLLTASGGFIQQTADCPAGKVVLGGGAQVVGAGTADFNTLLQESTPGTVGGGATSLWLASMKNVDASPHTVAIRATCANGP